MNDERELIPPPPIVREHLACHLRRARLLRSLLRLSLRAESDRRQESHQEADGRGDGDEG